MFMLPTKRIIFPFRDIYRTNKLIQNLRSCTTSVHCRNFRTSSAALKDDTTSDMSRQSYWEKYYRTKQPEGSEPYDWFFPYKVAKPYLLQHIHQQSALLAERSTGKPPILQVMELGCGTSDLSAQLFVDEPHMHIHCVDFAEEAIQIMRDKYIHFLPETEHSPGIQFRHCNVSNLPFTDSRFNICFEKGTIDAVLKQKKHATSYAVEVICEVARVLKEDGVFLQFTEERPELRLSVLEKAKVEILKSRNRNFSVSFKEVGDFSGIEFFLYIMQDINNGS
ncbi:citrate synthase-lysine N-methyltransferase CSKMT, mitochondrial-like [Amphiura filiformis]|uniref:citrate synthase-lysine N-methyltransferase CSKMT, mitochondrial-like n=1 Tax=Amphiura filiformis TaxID=82378 RepID=UPI003B222D1A